MEKLVILEWIGYLASIVLTIASVMIVKFRAINLVGYPKSAI